MGRPTREQVLRWQAERERKKRWKRGRNKWRTAEWAYYKWRQSLHPDPLNACRRPRQKAFVLLFVRFWALTKNVERAAMLAAKGAYYQREAKPGRNVLRMTDDGALKKGLDELQRPQVCLSVQRLFEQQGFSLEDAIEMQIKHIKGEITEQAMTKDGEVVDLKSKPNYAALKDLLGMVIPKQATQINIDQKSQITALVMDEMKTSLPPISQRELPNVTPTKVTVKEIEPIYEHEEP